MVKKCILDISRKNVASFFITKKMKKKTLGGSERKSTVGVNYQGIS